MITGRAQVRSMKKALYPGTFDPITNGHVDIIKRALVCCDELLIAIALNQEKSPLFSIAERKDMLEQCFKHEPRIVVKSFQGLLVDFAAEQNCSIIVRGLRSASDFEYEYQLSAMNRKLAPQIDSLYFMTSNDSFFLSSRLIKEVASLGGDVTSMLPPHVAQALSKKLGRGEK
jgi:pantetheine-phosphate adenylyltransferase